MTNTPEDIKKFFGDIFPSALPLKPEEIELYKEALTHASGNTWPNNLRLAFVGDAVLELIIRKHLFQEHPTWVHGRLTETCNKIKSNENFAKIAEKIGFERYMDIVDLPTDNIKLRAGVIEAVFGAIYLKRGFKEAKRLADSINFIEEAIASIEQ